MGDLFHTFNTFCNIELLYFTRFGECYSASWSQLKLRNLYICIFQVDHKVIMPHVPTQVPIGFSEMPYVHWKL